MNNPPVSQLARPPGAQAPQGRGLQSLMDALDHYCSEQGLTPTQSRAVIDLSLATKLPPQQAHTLLLHAKWDADVALAGYRKFVARSGGSIVSATAVSEVAAPKFSTVQPPSAFLPQSSAQSRISAPTIDRQAAAIRERDTLLQEQHWRPSTGGDIRITNTTQPTRREFTLRRKSTASTDDGQNPTVSYKGQKPGGKSPASLQDYDIYDVPVSSEASSTSGLFVLSKFRNCVNIGTRPFRYYLRPNLSVYVAHVSRLKTGSMHSIEVILDGNKRLRAGWSDGTSEPSFKSTFEFDEFDVRRSWLKFIVWERHTIRDDRVAGDCLVPLSDLKFVPEGQLPRNFPMRVKFLRGYRRLDARDWAGAKISLEIVLTFPNRDYIKPAEIGVQCDLEPLQKAVATLGSSGTAITTTTEVGGTALPNEEAGTLGSATVAAVGSAASASRQSQISDATDGSATVTAAAALAANVTPNTSHSEEVAASQSDEQLWSALKQQWELENPVAAQPPNASNMTLLGRNGLPNVYPQASFRQIPPQAELPGPTRPRSSAMELQQQQHTYPYRPMSSYPQLGGWSAQSPSSQVLETPSVPYNHTLQVYAADNPASARSVTVSTMGPTGIPGGTDYPAVTSMVAQPGRSVQPQYPYVAPQHSHPRFLPQHQQSQQQWQPDVAVQNAHYNPQGASEPNRTGVFSHHQQQQAPPFTGKTTPAADLPFLGPVPGVSPTMVGSQMASGFRTTSHQEVYRPNEPTIDRSQASLEYGYSTVLSDDNEEPASDDDGPTAAGTGFSAALPRTEGSGGSPRPDFPEPTSEGDDWVQEGADFDPRVLAPNGASIVEVFPPSGSVITSDVHGTLLRGFDAHGNLLPPVNAPVGSSSRGDGDNFIGAAGFPDHAPFSFHPVSQAALQVETARVDTDNQQQQGLIQASNPCPATASELGIVFDDEPAPPPSRAQTAGFGLFDHSGENDKQHDDAGSFFSSLSLNKVPTAITAPSPGVSVAAMNLDDPLGALDAHLGGKDWWGTSDDLEVTEVQKGDAMTALAKAPAFPDAFDMPVPQRAGSGHVEVPQSTSASASASNRGAEVTAMTPPSFNSESVQPQVVLPGSHGGMQSAQLQGVDTQNLLESERSAQVLGSGSRAAITGVIAPDDNWFQTTPDAFKDNKNPWGTPEEFPSQSGSNDKNAEATDSGMISIKTMDTPWPDLDDGVPGATVSSANEDLVDPWQIPATQGGGSVPPQQYI